MGKINLFEIFQTQNATKQTQNCDKTALFPYIYITLVSREFLEKF